MAEPLVTNIGASGRRRRYIMGGVALGVGLIAAVLLIAFGAARGARVALFLPFFAGAFGVLQARGGT
jgi:hypothetical protein